MKVVGIIPARLASTRLPKKVLQEIAGKPLIQHVFENAKKAKGLDDVIVACDSKEVLEKVQAFGGKAVLTSEKHKSGTERLSEVAEKIDADVIINIQGDEPLISPRAIELLVEEFSKNKELKVGTVGIEKHSIDEYNNPNVVKVVTDKDGRCLYFSRSPIPFYRDRKEFKFIKHLGIYGYRRKFLLDLHKLKDSFLEEKERLEQLRFLENGVQIKLLLTDKDSIGIDTEEDLKKVENILGKKG